MLVTINRPITDRHNFLRVLWQEIYIYDLFVGRRCTKIESERYKGYNRMIKSARSDPLKHSFEKHFAET